VFDARLMHLIKPVIHSFIQKAELTLVLDIYRDGSQVCRQSPIQVL